MELFDKYGPNTRQVKRFIERVGALTAKERESADFEAQLASSAFGSSNTYEVQVAAESKYGRDHEEKVIRPARKELDKAIGDGDPLFHIRARIALMGLILCHEIMDDAEFATWYGPFARIVPIESLGEGLAPKIRPPSLFPEERFVTRVVRIQNWHAIESAHMMLRCAVGSERHGEAIDAAMKIMDEPANGPVQEAYRESMSRALEDIERLGTGPSFKRSEMGLDMLGSALQREGITKPIDWAIRTANRQFAQAEFIERFRHCCQDAVIALALFGELADEHSYYLYAPFEAVIPIDSVLFP